MAGIESTDDASSEIQRSEHADFLGMHSLEADLEVKSEEGFRQQGIPRLTLEVGMEEDRHEA